MTYEPPCIEVLWCISFHTTALVAPLVCDVPTVKISRASKAFFSNFNTSCPSRVLGKYASRVVP